MKEQLEKKSYKDLKTLAKENGIPANQKKVVLIEQLSAKFANDIKDISVDTQVPLEEVTAAAQVVLGDNIELTDPESDASVEKALSQIEKAEQLREILNPEEVLEEYVNENKLPQDTFDELIFKAILSKVPGRIDLEKLYADYVCDKSVKTEENAVVNWAIKRVLK